MDAIDDLGDAIDTTRNLLLPIRAGLWLKLAIVVLFVGGMGLGGGVVTPGEIEPLLEEPEIDDPAVDEPAVEEPVADELPEGVDPGDLLAIAALVLVVLLFLWLLFAVISAIMEFVFVESLRSKEVRILRFGWQNLVRGLQLVLFRLFTLLLVGGLGIALFLTVGGPILEDFSSTAAAFLLFVLAVALYAPYAIVMRFTSEFVAPIMLLEGRNILSGWSRFWGTVTSDLAEYGVYLILVWILQLVVSIAVSFLLAIAGLVVAIPFVILVVVLFFLGEIGALLAIPVAILGVLAFLLVVGLVQMPFRTYFQYYALLLLGDTNPDLDLIPDQRAAVREDRDEPVEPTDRDEGPSAPDGRWGADGRDEEETGESSLWDETTERDDEDEDDGRGW
ncbi:DUF7544 domain-containing protein [Natronobacterium texcoconense]|uniref:Membrane domain of glycerophosphoryl diester phosphodiesterase n=1 Tax=Natronobacterium texcoconense TaxID=1095778 RepID=A0A1H1BHW5_NATTX|nr:hypothetical protein [Natronobacterium texcoconense]SDQ51453.1 hypothetical protein SAMN04489842_1047 [Natronobacterium texcoconense]